MRTFSVAREGRIALCFALLLGWASAVWSQSLVTINGTIADQTGAIVPNATVTATNLGTGNVTTSHSDGAGRYALIGLSAGFYDVTASAQGFATVIRSHEELFVGSTVTFNFALTVSSEAQTVQVTAEQTLLQQTQSTVQNMLQTSQLDNLPIVGRTFSDLAALTAGVQISTPGTPTTVTSNVTINSAPTYETGFVVDGIPVTRPADSGLYATYAQDWIQEFSVLTNQFTPEFGGAAGGIVNSLTRSGTNAFHGRAYEFYQNDEFNSNPAFLAAGGQQTLFIPGTRRRNGGRSYSQRQDVLFQWL